MNTTPQAALAAALKECMNLLTALQVSPHHRRDVVSAARAALAQAEAAQTLPLKARPEFMAGYDAGLADGRRCAERDAAEAAQPVAGPIIAARYRNSPTGRWTYADHDIGSIEADGWREVTYLCDANAAPQPAEAAQPADLASENAELRHLLAVRVAGALLYADDGELQDASESPAIDFKRDTPGEISRKLTDRGLKWLTRPAKAARVHALVNAGAYPGMSEAFDAHMGAACWTEPDYRPDAATWAAAWKAALSAAEAAPKQEAAELAEALAAAKQSYASPDEPEFAWCTLQRRHVEVLCAAAQPQQPAPEPVAPRVFSGFAQVVGMPDTERKLQWGDENIEGRA